MAGNAILIGTSKVCQKHYTGPMDLPYALNDVTAIRKIIDSTGLYSNIVELTNENAKADTFLKLIDDFAKPKTEDGFLLIFFSGHGASFPYETSDTREFLCFYDRMLVENEMRSHLINIPKNIKVFFIMNSCFSSGMSEAHLTFLGALEKLSLFLRTENTFTYEDLTHDSQNWMRSVFRISEGIDRVDTIVSTYRKHNGYKDILSIYNQDYTNYLTEICYLNSCKKNQRTDIGRWVLDPSYFIDKLITCWDSWKDYKINYADFTKELKSLMKSSTEPNIDVYPKNKVTVFDTAHPFEFIPENQLPVKPQIMIQLSTTETGGKNPVYLNVNGGAFTIVPQDSDTFDLTENNSTNHIYRNVIDKIQPILEEGIRYLSILEVRSSTGTSSSHEVPRLLSADLYGLPNGLIILHDDTAQDNLKIKGRKRTDGKVTNKMGPS